MPTIVYLYIEPVLMRKPTYHYAWLDQISRLVS